MAAPGGETPLITVQPGGELIIRCADFDLSGERRANKTGTGRVRSHLTGLCGVLRTPSNGRGRSRATAMYAPEDMYLEVGHAADGGAACPQTLGRGPGPRHADRRAMSTLALSWELGEYNGQSRGRMRSSQADLWMKTESPWPPCGRSSVSGTLVRAG